MNDTLKYALIILVIIVVAIPLLAGLVALLIT